MHRVPNLCAINQRLVEFTFMELRVWKLTVKARLRDDVKCGALLVDFCKASNSLSNDLLLAKLSAYGFKL